MGNCSSSAPSLYSPHIIRFGNRSYWGLVMLRNFFAYEEGQGLVEYALILVLIAIVVIGILTLLGGRVSTVFSRIDDELDR
jgi:pilus assembly protein Flp/PilA